MVKNSSRGSLSEAMRWALLIRSPAFGINNPNGPIIARKSKGKFLWDKIKVVKHIAAG